MDILAKQHLNLLKSKSAFFKIRPLNRVFLFLILAGILVLSLFFPYAIGIPIFCIGFVNYLYLLIFRIQNNLSPVPPSASANRELTVEDLPSITIILPLKNEDEVIRGTLNAINDLQYPQEKKQVIVVIEDTDRVTLSTISRIELKPNVEILLIPEAAPFTKGRALLHGIRKAEGEIITVYDAESRPERDQLMKAVSILSEEKSGLCLQAKIHISNKSGNWITRNFAGEYYEWYERHLKTLSHEGFSFGLGGNSFFIRRKDLLNAGAWDPFNVTEDADLAVRLIENGVRIRLFDSVTKETCPKNLTDWSNQRTRWNKGLFITQLVHLPGSVLNGKFRFSQWVNFWLPMVGSALVPFYNFFIPLFMVSAGLSYYTLTTMSISLWTLLGINLLSSTILNRITYQRINIESSFLSIFTDVLAYLLIHLYAGFKAYAEYFISPLHWHKTIHKEDKISSPADPTIQTKAEIQSLI